MVCSKLLVNIKKVCIIPLWWSSQIFLHYTMASKAQWTSSVTGHWLENTQHCHFHNNFHVLHLQPWLVNKCCYWSTYYLKQSLYHTAILIIIISNWGSLAVSGFAMIEWCPSSCPGTSCYDRQDPLLKLAASMNVVRSATNNNTGRLVLQIVESSQSHGHCHGKFI